MALSLCLQDAYQTCVKCSNVNSSLLCPLGGIKACLNCLSLEESTVQSLYTFVDTAVESKLCRHLKTVAA